MDIQSTAIDGAYGVTSTRFKDERGSFGRLFCDRELVDILQGRSIVQVNNSVTNTPGAVRGMHLQKAPNAEMKFVRCLRGRAWDVAIDLRLGSKTVLQYHAMELSPENGKMFVIPEGCAHGFQALEPETELLYFHTAYYVLESEWGVKFDDPLIGINWPLDAIDVSERDQTHEYLSDDFRGIDI